MRVIRNILLTAACLPLLAGCVQDPLPSASPEVVEQQEIALPPKPKRALTIGVYRYIDTTGQRRPTGSGQELSSAVPMDCTPYLVEAVRSLTPGYVFLVERQHVDELLRERQLATLALNGAAEAAAAAAGGQRPVQARRLNTLRVAELILVGQVVAYDRQTRQVTAGMALGGVGGDSTVVTDLITFSLRAVAVQTGEILAQTTVTKSITSQKVGAHMTRIWPTAVFDAEIGGGANEPVGLALHAAIRGALDKLISSGVKDGWWA